MDYYHQKWIPKYRLLIGPVYPFGLHLFNWNGNYGNSQGCIALSYSEQSGIKGSQNSSWERRYLFSFDDPKTGIPIELDLIGYVVFHRYSYIIQYRYFCYFAPLFDVIAESLNYCPDKYISNKLNKFLPC